MQVQSEANPANANRHGGMLHVMVLLGEAKNMCHDFRPYAAKEKIQEAIKEIIAMGGLPFGGDFDA